jgi:hypothetical protein
VLYKVCYAQLCGKKAIGPQHVTGRPLHVSSTGITLPTQYPEDRAQTPDAMDTHQAAGAQDDLVRKTICFSTSIARHDIVIGLFVNGSEWRLPV